LWALRSVFAKKFCALPAEKLKSSDFVKSILVISEKNFHEMLFQLKVRLKS
jgi:hypothetical protein